MAGRGRPPARNGAVRARVAVVTARWNSDITEALTAGALAAAHAARAHVDTFTVAGSFELSAAATALAETGRYDAVVPIGCLIRGETPHFDVLAEAVAAGLMELSTRGTVAVSFGVLTCDTVAQARARAGGRKGNKGAEAMEAALEMTAFYRSIASSQRRTARRASRAASRSTS